MNRTVQTRWIVLSERVYRALLVLYPVDYRREYGPLMVQLFRDVSLDKYHRRGMAGVVLWWCKTLLDLILSVIEQRRRDRSTMSKATFVQFTGIMLIVGGICSTAAAFSQFFPGDNSYHDIYQALFWLFAPGSFLVGLGCIGLGLGYGQALGTVGRWALYFSGASALVMAAGIVASSIENTLWVIWTYSSVVHIAALVVFGLVHLRRPALPIFRALPLQIAAGWLVLLTGVLRTDSQMYNNMLWFLMFAGIGLAWLAIGLVVNRQQRQAMPEPA